LYPYNDTTAFTDLSFDPQPVFRGHCSSATAFVPHSRMTVV
jgi:hypothetical protein